MWAEIRVPGSRISELGSVMLDPGYSCCDPGSGVCDQGSVIRVWGAGLRNRGLKFRFPASAKWAGEEGPATWQPGAAIWGMG